MFTLLDYEKEILLDVFNENSLTICSRGLSHDRILASLVQIYSNSCHLLLVIGTDTVEEDSIVHHLTESLPKAGSSVQDEDQDGEHFVMPRKVTAETVSVANRRDYYLQGGVIFVTSRILVVDMLTKRLPFESVSGILVVNAHRVVKDCTMSFILRLFRMENRQAFISAISQNASSFTRGSFGQLERIMRMLFVSKLHLWPRFHGSIQAVLSERPPDVVEMRIYMTTVMKQIQFALGEFGRC